MIILFIVKVKILFFFFYNIKSCRPPPIMTTRIVNKLWMSHSPTSFEHVFMVFVLRSNLTMHHSNM